MKRWMPSAVLLLLCAGCGGTQVDVPEVDYSGMEPQVAERLRSSSSSVLDEPESAQAWGALGMDYHAHTLYAEAADCYERAAELDAQDYRWPYLAGVCRARLDAVTALALFERAAALEPANAGFHVRFGDLLVQAEEPERAAESYRKALELDSGMSHALYGLGLVAMRAGDLDESLSKLQRAAEIAPHHGEVHKLLAQVHQRRGETELAEIAALSAQAFPDESGARDAVIEEVNSHAVSSRAYSTRGLALARAGRYADAEVVFRQVLELRQGNSRDFANLGGALAGQGRLDEAIESYREALRITPEETFARNNLALALMSRGKPEEAEAELREALRLDPTYADAHFNLGLLHQNQGRLDEAVRVYREALAANPAHGKSYNNLAKLLAERGEEAEALELWRKAASINALDVEAMYNLAVLSSRTGDHAGAIRQLDRAMRRAPNSSILAQALAAELSTAPEAGLRDGPRAVELATRVYQQYPGRPEVGDTLAAALAENGEFERAIEIAREAMRQARDADRTDLAKRIQLRIERYEKNRPARQGSSPSLNR